jgi:hypothetical protein
MAMSMFKASTPIFVQFLTSLSTKAAAHAEAKKIDPSVLPKTCGCSISVGQLLFPRHYGL